jgi:hypothetical protein
VATAYRHFRRRKFFILGDDENIHLNLSGETSLNIFFRALTGPRAPIPAPHMRIARSQPASAGPNGAESPNQILYSAVSKHRRACPGRHAARLRPQSTSPEDGAQ